MCDDAQCSIIQGRYADIERERSGRPDYRGIKVYVAERVVMLLRSNDAKALDTNIDVPLFVQGCSGFAYVGKPGGESGCLIRTNPHQTN